MKELLESGVHYGHHTSRWNPKMKPYIFRARHSIHVIDLRQTVRGLVRGRRFLSSVAEQGGEIVIVGTKRQARQVVQDQANRAGLPYVSERWLGGMFTNFEIIMARLRRLKQLEALQASGEIEARGKKYASVLRRELTKLQRNLGGIRNMRRPPDAIIVIDPRREKNAIAEARALDIPIICFLDTDADPDNIDVVIPGNDDAMRSISLVVTKLVDSIIEGQGKFAETAKGASVPMAEPVPPYAKAAPVVETSVVSAHTTPPGKEE